MDVMWRPAVAAVGTKEEAMRNYLNAVFPNESNSSILSESATAILELLNAEEFDLEVGIFFVFFASPVFLWCPNFSQLLLSHTHTFMHTQTYIHTNTHIHTHTHTHTHNLL
jgi:hypothetical protein